MTTSSAISPLLPTRLTLRIAAAAAKDAHLGFDAVRRAVGPPPTFGTPNFRFRRKPFLHFHTDPASGGLYADVKLGGARTSDFEPVWASTPAEREYLLRGVRNHIRRAARR